MTEKPAHTNIAGIKQLYLLIETVGSEEFLVGIAYPFRSDGASWNEPTIKPNIVHSNQSTGWGHSDQDLSLGSLNIGTDVQSGGFGRNIDSRTGVNLQGLIGTISLDINSARILPLKRLWYLTNCNASRNYEGKSEDPSCNDIFKIYGRKNFFKLKKLSTKIRIRYTLNWITATQNSLYKIKLTRNTSNRINID